MKETLILMSILLSAPVFNNQELHCCKSEREVEIYLSGSWKKKDSDPDRQFRFEFNDGKGTFKVFLFKKEKGILEEIKENQPDIKILKNKKGFEIEHDFDGLKTYSGIKHLDSSKLIITRNDGAEKEYFKVSD